MRKSRLFPMSISILFCTVILLPLLFVNLQQDKISLSENRYLENFPQIIDAQGSFSRSQFFKLEDWINDNIGFREDARKLSTEINLHIFHSSPDYRVHIGNQGWYYYTLENNLNIAFGTYPINEQVLSNIAVAQQKIKDTLSQKGIEYILVLAPSKCSIYPEYIGYSGLKIQDTPIDVVEQYLEENTNITVVNTKPALLNAKSRGHQVFCKTDTHWNEYGAYVAYNCVAESVSKCTGKDMRSVEIQTKPTTRLGDLTQFIGVTDISEEEETESVIAMGAYAVEDDTNDIIRQLSSQYDDVYTQGQPRVFLNNTAHGTLLIFSDSFFNDFNVGAWMAESYGKTIHVRSSVAKMEAIDLVKPDIIVCEITERSILYLQQRGLSISSSS